MKSGSDHEVIQFELSENESEWVECPFNASYNIVKADWVKFAETLQLNSSKSLELVKLAKLVKLATQTSHLNENSKTYTLLEELAIHFRNLIVNAADQHISKRKASSKAKV